MNEQKIKYYLINSSTAYYFAYVSSTLNHKLLGGVQYESCILNIEIVRIFSFAFF